eukprot:scaffold5880_cov32-Phaeocystis_antarctica.AAC.2
MARRGGKRRMAMAAASSSITASVGELTRRRNWATAKTSAAFANAMPQAPELARTGVRVPPPAQLRR